MSRFALIAVAVGLAGCPRSKSAPVIQPPPVDDTKSCGDAAANLAGLIDGSISDLEQLCVDQSWTVEVVECVAAAAAKETAEACFAAMVAATPVCTTLAALTEAGRDPQFTSIRGEPGYAATSYDFWSTVSLTGAVSCGLYVKSDHATASCDMVKTTDEDEWNRVYNETGAAVNTCLTSAGWTIEELGGGGLRWLHPSGELPTVLLEASRLVGSGSVEGTVRVDVTRKW